MRNVLLTANTATQAVTAGSVISPGTAVHGYGQAIRLNGNAINLTAQGYYSVVVNATMTVTGTAAAGIQLYADGTAIPGAVATATPAAAGEVVNVSIPWVIRKGCACNATALTVAATAAGSVTNIVAEVERL